MGVAIQGATEDICADLDDLHASACGLSPRGPSARHLALLAQWPASHPFRSNCPCGTRSHSPWSATRSWSQRARASMPQRPTACRHHDDPIPPCPSIPTATRRSSRRGRAVARGRSSNAARASASDNVDSVTCGPVHSDYRHDAAVGGTLRPGLCSPLCSPLPDVMRCRPGRRGAGSCGASPLAGHAARNRPSASASTDDARPFSTASPSGGQLR